MSLSNITLSSITKKIPAVLASAALIVSFGFPNVSVASSSAVSSAAESSSIVTSVSIVNVNTATAEQISSALKGIGLKKAQAIVEWRESNGKFAYIDQLLAVKGIGEKTLSDNQSLIEL